MATIEIPDEDVNLVKSALGRAGALLEWEGKTQKKADKRERLTNEGAALLSLAMQLTFVELEPEDVAGPSVDVQEMRDIVEESYDAVAPAGGESYVAPVVEDERLLSERFTDPDGIDTVKYIEGGYEEDHGEDVTNDKWDGIRDHDNDHS